MYVTKPMTFTSLWVTQFLVKTEHGLATYEYSRNLTISREVSHQSNLDEGCNWFLDAFRHIVQNFKERKLHNTVTDSFTAIFEINSGLIFSNILQPSAFKNSTSASAAVKQTEVSSRGARVPTKSSCIPMKKSCEIPYSLLNRRTCAYTV